MDGEAALLELYVEGLERGVNQLRRVHGLKVVGFAARLDAREVQYVVDELRQAAALRLYVLAVLPYLLIVGDAAHLQKLAEDAYRGQGRAQLVRDVGDKIRLHLREPHLSLRGAQREDDAREQRHR